MAATRVTSGRTRAHHEAMSPPAESPRTQTGPPNPLAMSMTESAQRGEVLGADIARVLRLEPSVRPWSGMRGSSTR